MLLGVADASGNVILRRSFAAPRLVAVTASMALFRRDGGGLEKRGRMGRLSVDSGHCFWSCVAVLLWIPFYISTGTYSSPPPDFPISSTAQDSASSGYFFIP